MAKGIYISDSIHGLTQLSEYEKKIIASVGFNRLHDVYQNSTVYLTYPSNRTKRFEHSIGTMNLCSKMFYNSVTNSTSETLDSFYKIYRKELDSIIKSIKTKREYKVILKKFPDAIPKLNWDNFQVSLIPGNVPDQYRKVHMVLIQAIRAAALLHDIGHPPYSHVVERAMKTAYEKNKWKQDAQNSSIETLNYLDKMSQYEGKKKPLHEAMGIEISENILKGIFKQSSDANENLEYLSYEILVLESVLKILEDEGNFSYLHRIIDNSVDGDRLDYVTRDPANSGMNVGSIDYNRIIMDMRIMEETNGSPIFAIPLKAVNAVEDFLKRRYDLYKNIICHHRVIKTDYLMEYAVTDLIDRYLETADKGFKDKDTTDVTDVSEENEAIPFDISGLWTPLGNQTLAQSDCILSQWNDSWLITVLKKIYYEQYYGILDITDPRYIVSKQFSELLNNERNYITIIKRHEDFKFIDDAVKKVISKNIDVLQRKKDNLLEKSKEASNKEETEQEENVVDVTKFLKEIDDMIKYAGSNDNEFIMARLWHRKRIFSLETMENGVKEIVQSTCRETLQGCKVLNSIVVFKEISLGIETKKDEQKEDKKPRTIYFFDNAEKLCSLDDVSGVINTLRTENLFQPVFYLYLLLDDSEKRKLSSDEKELLLTRIGGNIGELVLNTINQNIDSYLK